jgi:hypothetical protein
MTAPRYNKWIGVRSGLALAMAFTALTAAARAEEKPYPPPAPPADPSALGAGVQRTMTLLATSTPRQRNKVRVLFYGQSITEQSWSRAVADDLRRRFPDADLDIQNRAIGGFASQRLVRPAEHDLYPFYPDLLIFHVYGSNQEYEEIIRNVRTRTTAEVLMQSDHVTKWPPDAIDQEKDKGAWWDNLMNTQLLPGIARKYGCTLLDVRNPWLQYLKANHLQPSDLLKDGVHLNDHGNYLMAELVKRYLVHRPDLHAGDWKELVRDYEVGRDVTWQDGKLTLEVEGNRVDALGGAAGEPSRPLRVTIDGKSPSTFPGCYAITRPKPGPWSPLTVVRIDSEKPPVVEDWTLTIKSVTDDSAKWTFDVTGTKTGPDGSGAGDAPFVSNSGRVKIDPRDWFRNGKVPQGYTIKWTVQPLFNDEVTPGDRQVTLAQGLPNTKHTLVLAGGPDSPVRAIRVYRPPIRQEKARAAGE